MNVFPKPDSSPDPVLVSSDLIDAEILSQTARRGPSSSICPTDVARALAADWRLLLHRVRERAAGLARAGNIEILRKGKPIQPEAMHGVIRLRQAAPAPAAPAHQPLDQPSASSSTEP